IRASSKKGNYQHIELSLSPPNRRRRGISTSPVADLPSRGHSTPPYERFPPPRNNQPFVAMARNQVFPSFNAISPFMLAQRDSIPVAALKSLPFYTGETHVTPVEHLFDAAKKYVVHNITEDNVAVRLLATSFKGKALQWFR
ncbi:hypothetical protein KI387_032859, partial [Taxus chinensis]